MIYVMAQHRRENIYFKNPTVFCLVWLAPPTILRCPSAFIGTVVHCIKRLAIFPSPAQFGQWHPAAGDGKIANFFYSVGWLYCYCYTDSRKTKREVRHRRCLDSWEKGGDLEPTKTTAKKVCPSSNIHIPSTLPPPRPLCEECEAGIRLLSTRRRNLQAGALACVRTLCNCKPSHPHMNSILYTGTNTHRT